MDTNVLGLRNRHNVLVRHHGADHPDTVAARDALALARVEARIAAAVEAAPPLPADLSRRFVDLIRAATSTADGGAAS